jgi:hypothetical protein
MSSITGVEGHHLIFGQFRDEPWYGKNAGLMEGLPTGLCHVELTGCHFLSVPRPVATQRHRRAAIHVCHEPQRACRRHDQTERVGTDNTLPFAALVLPEPIKGVTVTDGNFHDPAVAIRAYNLFRAQGEIGGEKGFDRWEGFALARLFGGRGLRTAQHDDPHEAPRQHSMPQAIPGLDRCACFAGVGHPPCGGLRQGLGRADQVAFFAWGTATLGGMGWRHRIELRADGEAPHDMDRLGQPTDIVFGGIATVRQAPDGAPGHLLG